MMKYLSKSIILFITIFVSFSGLFAKTTEQDSIALVTLYNSTNGENWINSSNWLSDSLISTWYGITTDSGRVTKIDLNSNNLTGPIPVEIGNLFHLQQLYLHKNNICDSIPKEIGNLIKLQQIYLQSNQLSGSIPTEIGNLVKLSYLNFSSNLLSGAIPLTIGNLINLRQVYLNSNQLTDSIPPGIGNLTKLIDLNLSSNKLSGTIPTKISNLINLKQLNLHDNQLIGSIPKEIGKLIKLQQIYLNSNQLSGEIPKEICEPPNLQQIYLSLNHLSGTIPIEIGNLKDLIYLYLNDNQLNDTITSKIGNLTNLQALYLQNNQLHGPIPQEIGRLPYLHSMYLNNNDLSGMIPDSIINNKNLSRLRLDHNRFDGLTNLSSLSKITELYIEENRLTFEDIEPNINIPGIYYSPQDSIGELIDTTVFSGSTFKTIIETGGTANIYQWYKDGTAITGADSNIYEISPVSISDAGSYSCKITNTMVTDLTLNSRPINIDVDIATSAKSNDPVLPVKYSLEQNYPNPFNPTTMIKFSLPKQTRVKISIYDIQGRRVTQLVDAQESAGYHAVKFDASVLSAGLYFYVLDAEKFHQVKKMMLLK